MLYYALPSRRRICLSNLAFALPDKTPAERITLCKEVYAHIGYTLGEMASLWFKPLSELDSRFTLTGMEHIDQVLDSGRGVILLQAHFTTLELCGTWIGTQLKQSAALVDDPRNKLYAALLRRSRLRYVDDIINNRETRKMIRLLRSGGLVWYSPDQSVRRRDGGVETTFFGKHVLTTPGASRMAKMTGAAILPFLPVRTANGHYQLTVFPPLEHVPSDDAIADTQAFNHVFESHIREHPSQYFWVHKRFKRISEDQPDPYQ